MTKPPIDYPDVPKMVRYAAAASTVVDSVALALRMKGRGLAWLGFWIALAVLGSNAMWAWVVDRDSEREYFVRSMQVLQDATAKGARL